MSGSSGSEIKGQEKPADKDSPTLANIDEDPSEDSDLSPEEEAELKETVALLMSRSKKTSKEERRGTLATFSVEDPIVPAQNTNCNL